MATWVTSHISSLILTIANKVRMMRQIRHCQGIIFKCFMCQCYVWGKIPLWTLSCRSNATNSVSRPFAVYMNCLLSRNTNKSYLCLPHQICPVCPVFYTFVSGVIINYEIMTSRSPISFVAGNFLHYEWYETCAPDHQGNKIEIDDYEDKTVLNMCMRAKILGTYANTVK